VTYRSAVPLIIADIDPAGQYTFAYLANRKMKPWSISRDTLERGRAAGTLKTFGNQPTLVSGACLLAFIHKQLGGRNGAQATE